MDRLTTDTPNNNLQNILNLFYVKDHEAYVRGGGPAPDFKDISLNDFSRRIAERYHLDLPESDEELPDAMFECLVDGIDTMDGILALIYNAGWAFAEIRHRLAAYEDTDLTAEEIEQQLKNFSSFLMEMTGGQMSKTNYTVEAMVTVANDYQQREIDELEQELEQVKAERDALALIVKNLSACTHCKHVSRNVSEEPCADCNEDKNYPNWEWRGAKDTNVPAKKEE